MNVEEEKCQETEQIRDVQYVAEAQTNNDSRESMLER